MLGWSVIHTKIARELPTAMGITSLGFPTFYPLHRRKRIHNHQIEHVIGPLFPRYIFVQFDREQDRWGEILLTKGVSSILRNCDNKPAIVRDEVITAMKERLEASPQAIQPDPVYAVGQKVKIVNGPAYGYEALFEGTAKDRTIALLSLLGRQVKVKISDITPAN